MNKQAGLIPIILIAVLLAALLGLGLRGQYIFNPPYLLLALSILFYWGVTPIVAYISAKSYLMNGSLTLLFVSLAFIVGVPFSVVAGGSSPNDSVTLGALGLLVSSALQFSGAAQASFGTVPVGSEHRKTRLVLAFACVLSISGLIILLNLLHVFPLFFVENLGVTLVDQAIYGLIILFFLVSSLLYQRLYLKTKSETLYWYSLALLLYGIGSFGITQQLVFGDLVVWVGRIGTYMGLLYFLAALLSIRREK
ncbi:MAG: hypothetical protein QG670_946 [Thermoproteota archaeon]|nr:hypothetical protein [Thermoproteota archaeon]